MNVEKAFTHGGKFHADDVFSSALLKILYPDIKIERGFEVPEDFDGIVFDIGLGEFDHHQSDARVRANGNPYASFGLLWERFGKEILGDEWEFFDEKFVEPIDLDDNTGCGNDVSDIITSFNPTWDSLKTSDECFFEAVDFAKTILTKKFDYTLSLFRGNSTVKECFSKAKDKIVVLPKFIPWKQVLVDTNAEFVVFPSDRGGYNAQVVPKSRKDKEPRVNFPEEWAGKSKEELVALTGIKTLKFCHNSRFMVATDEFSDIIQACEMAKKL
ncbi:MAG: MYG1 family protein [Tyzzerella sp.]|uniref:MYG1 family protein n=1 Tax=Candidatus Fimicola merdigallinarum TaxID=2840819 RepID=A0A9D9DUB3_9FIRM|nr:MYG1 family protein [Candidatus Fimicola merdigallinarum]